MQVARERILDRNSFDRSVRKQDIITARKYLLLATMFFPFRCGPFRHPISTSSYVCYRMAEYVYLCPRRGHNVGRGCLYSACSPRFTTRRHHVYPPFQSRFTALFLDVNTVCHGMEEFVLSTCM